MRRMMAGGCAVLLWASACFGRAVTVTGNVVDYQARPVAGAQVAVVENGTEWDTQLQDARMCAPVGRTDESGRFEIAADVESVRNMFVVARKSGLAFGWDRAPLQASSAGRISFHLVLEKPATIAGTVVDAAGRAMAGATVRAVPKTCYLSRLNQSPISLPQAWLSTQTDGQGRFRFDAFCIDVSCDFWVQAQDRSCVPTFTPNYLPGCGFEVGRSDIRLVVPDERRVCGRVVEQGTGTPAAGVDLEISRPRERSRREDVKDAYLPYRVRSDAEGRFIFPGVPEGDHEIRLAPPEQEPAAWVAEPISVVVGPDHLTDDVTFEVDRGGLVELIVRHAQTRKPIAGICVSLPNMSRRSLPRTDGSGLARARLRPGEAMALISNGMPGNEEYRSWGLRGTGERLTIKCGETVRLEVELEPGNKIRGRVVGPDGKPVRGAPVQIHPPSTGSRIVSNIGDQFNTDEKGRFEYCCGDADPRGWYVTARCDDKSWVGMAAFEQADQPVQVRLGAPVTVKGTVTDEAGVGIAAARVTVSGRLSGAVSNMTTETLCDVAGAFSLSGVLPPDEATVYRLSVDACGYGPKSYVEIEVSDQAGEVTDLGQIALATADASLVGVVVDANDRPVADIPIFLRRASREVSQPAKTTATDEHGRFRFDRICKGSAHLQANFRSYPQGWCSTTVESGPEAVKLVLHPASGTVGVGRRRVAAARSTPQYVSLAGKALSQVEGLESLVPTEAGDKPLLILLMDQQQRPSRRLVQELVGQMDLLKAKGIEVVVLQVAKIDRADLDRWLAEEKVPFKVQIVPGDFDKQRYAWGIESLPWLILADRGQVVEAAGFALDELAAKIEGMTEKEPR